VYLSHSLQFRQAKLSFLNVYLLVGVSSDEQVKQHKFKCIMDHAERCESVRNCRWVDEVIPDAPWVIDSAFLEKYNIDFVAHDEAPYSGAGHEDVYTFVKSIGLSAPRTHVYMPLTSHQANSFQHVARRVFQQVFFLSV
jgi:choline-phosphate cytidylyltransferase